jgi:L-amino acid N-acyltransferase YncA
MPGRIRPVTLADVPAMVSIYGKVVLETAISFEFDPPTVQEFEARVEKVRAGGHPWLVMLDENEELAGYAYASHFRDRYGYRFCCESTIYMRSDVRGRGWGRVLYQTLLDTLIRQGFVAVIAGLTYPNPASEALHRAVGFELVGLNQGIGHKFGEWHGVCFLQKELCPRGESVGEKPVRFEELSPDF